MQPGPLLGGGVLWCLVLCLSTASSRPASGEQIEWLDESWPIHLVSIRDIESRKVPATRELFRRIDLLQRSTC